VRINTLVTLGASAVFGILAVVLARGWINEAIQSEFRQVPTLQTQLSSGHVETAPVIIADGDFSFGDELTPQALRLVQYPVDAVPVGAFASFDDLFIDSDKRTLVLSAIGLNEPILAHKINGPGGRGSLSALISEGMRAISVRMNDVDGVAGFVLPGDYIDVVFTRDDIARRNGAGNALVSDIILQNIRVLGIDQNLDTQSQAPDIAKAVTLEVTNAQAQALNLAMDAGRLSLTLRRAGEQSIDQVKTLKLHEIAKTPKPRAHKYVKKSRPKPTPQQSDISGTAQVTIIRGESRDAVNVVSENTISADPADQLAGG